MLGDFYPSGDEYELVYTATGRLIPPAGIPLNVGCVVNNVETLYNVHQAEQGKPVTREVPFGVRGGGRAEIVLGAGGHAVPRADRDGRRRDGGGFRSVHQRHHDGHPDVRSGRRGHEDHRRADRAAARPLPDDAADAVAAGDEPHRQIGLRPVQLLHRVLPALPAGLRGDAAQGDAQPGVHPDRRRHLEPVVGAVLRLRALHAVRLSRGPVPQGGLRPGQSATAARPG